MIPDPGSIPPKAETSCIHCQAPTIFGDVDVLGNRCCLKCHYLGVAIHSLKIAIASHGLDGETCQRQAVVAFDALVCVGPAARAAHDSLIAAFTAVEEGRVIGDSPAAKRHLSQALAEVEQAILIRTAHRRHGVKAS